MKIIHIASDEKFINSAYSQFEEIYPGENLFYLLVKETSAPLKYVEKKERMVVVTNDMATLKKLPAKFSGADLICFHGLSYYSSIVLNRTPLEHKVLWILWGMEVHNNPLLFPQRRNIGEETYRAYVKKSYLEKLKYLVKNRFRGILYRIRNQTASPNAEVVKAIQRANYCGIMYKEEFEFVQREVNPNIKHIKFCYYPIEKMLGNPEHYVNNNHILLGNSGSVTNNHLEAFALLKRFDLTGIKVYTPLSYGDKNYIAKTVMAGETSLKGHFLPLVHFMPLHDYNNYIRQCGIVIMNHHRQQAVGNVLVMLWMGAKIYLNESNTLYLFLKRIGAHVFSISQDLNNNNPKALHLLTQEQQLQNRRLLKHYVGQDVILKELKIQLDQIT